MGDWNYLCRRRSDGQLIHTSQTSPGGGCSERSPLGGAVQNGLAAAINLDGRLEVFARRPDGSVVEKADIIIRLIDLGFKA